MTTESNLIGVPIQWQAASLHKTQRGRFKRIICGIPGPLFWLEWKKRGAALRANMQAKGITLQKLAKGQWEVRLWISQRNLATALDLAESAGFTLPDEPVPQNNEPF